MARTHKRKLDARRYGNSYTPESLEEAVKCIKAGKMTLRKASAKFNIPTRTLSHKVNAKHTKNAGRPLVFNKVEELSFIKHIEAVAEWGFPFDVMDMRVLAQTYLNSKGRTVVQFSNNLPSTDWANNFLKRHQAVLTKRTCQNIKRSRAKVSAGEVKAYFTNLEKTIKDADSPPTHIFNYDETNLSDDPGVKKCVFKRGVKYP